MQQLLTGKTRLPGFDTAPGYKQTDLGPTPEIGASLRSVRHAVLRTATEVGIIPPDQLLFRWEFLL